MARLARHHHHVAAAIGDSRRQRLFGMQLGAVLVELGHQQPLPQLHIALLRFQFTDQNLEQGGLARAIGPHNGDAVAAMDAQREILDDVAVAIGKRHALGVDHLGAAGAAFSGFHLDRADLANLLAPLGAHAAQPRQPPDIALAPARHAIAHPVFLGSDAAFQLVALGIFLFQDFVAPGFERRKTLFQPMGLAPVQPHRDARQIFQEAAVMADQHQRALAGFQFAFQPFDGAHIQMVGGLVQQQNIGARRQSAGQRGAARLAARQGRRIFIAAQAEVTQQVKSAVGVFMRIEAGFDIFTRAGKAAHVGLLRQIADGGAGLREARAAIGFHQSRRDLQKRGFSRAVAPHQTQPLTRRHAEFRAVQQLGASERNGDVFQVQKRPHAPLCGALGRCKQAKSSGSCW